MLRDGEPDRSVMLAAVLVFFMSTQPLRLVTDVDVSASIAGSRLPARLDYESVDAVHRRLYSAFLGRNRMLVFDLAARRFAGFVPALDGVHGVLAVPALHRVFASATGSDEVVSIDPATLKVTGRAPGGDYPDGIAFDPVDVLLFVSDEHGGTETVVDPRVMRRLTTIDLGGEAGNSQYDPQARHVLVDVQARDDLVAIDPRTPRVVARYPLPGCDHDHGLLVDAVHRRAFVACDGNDVLLQVDLRSMRVVASAPVGGGPDVLALDPDLRRPRLYVACESGTVSVFDLRGSIMKKVADQFVATEAHTIAVDPATHFVYLPLENVGGHPVLRIMAPR